MVDILEVMVGKITEFNKENRRLLKVFFVKVIYLSKMIQLVILGAGNVASQLVNAFDESDKINVLQVYNRSIQSLENLNFKGEKISYITQLAQADCYIIAVSDDAVSTLSEQIPFKNKLVVHTSGSVSIEDLSNKNRRGVLYPLQTFSKEKIVAFSEIPFCIEAENEDDYQLLEKIARTVTNLIYKINSLQRKKLHLAAVFVCNFVNYLYQIGYEISQENDFSFDILKPLIKETAHKIENTPPKNAQTGPAKRNDQKTMAKHIEMLDLPEQKQIYQLLSKAIINSHGRKEL